jgi:hypothetical protein
MKNRMIPILSSTIALFEFADPRTPRTRMTVIAQTTRNAGRFTMSGTPRIRGQVGLRGVGRARGDGGRRVMGGAEVGAEPGRHRNPEMADQLAEIPGPSDGHADVAHRVFHDQVPPDDPGDELAQRSVGVGVGGARDRYHRRELGVAQRREAAGDRREQEREHDRRAGARPRRVADDGRAGGGEDPGADRGPDAERGEVPLVEGAREPAALADVLLAVLDRFTDEEGRHDPLLG